MGRVRTAAAKKYIEKSPSSDEDENLAEVKRSGRPKRTSNNDQSNQRAASSRPTRGTRSSAVNENQNGKNGVSSSSSASDLEEDAPVVNRKRNATNDGASPKKAKPSTSTTTKKSTENRPKKEGVSKKKKSKDEDRYEVEKILDHKIEDNVKYFLIRWKGYGSDVDSWESQYSISCPALLAKYYEKVRLFLFFTLV